MNDDTERLVRLQRLLGKLEQVSKQASDLGRMAKELHQEAHDSIQLVTDSADYDGGKGAKKTRTRRKARKRR
jgi:hypothetical protein